MGGGGTEQLPGLMEHMSVSGSEQAVIAHFDESVGQDVLQKATNKLFGSHRRESDLISGRFLVLKGDVALL